MVFLHDIFVFLIRASVLLWSVLINSNTNSKFTLKGLKASLNSNTINTIGYIDFSFGFSTIRSPSRNY